MTGENGMMIREPIPPEKLNLTCLIRTSNGITPRTRLPARSTSKGVKMVDMHRVFQITRKRVFHFWVFLFMFVITEIGRRIYRPYIYQNDIFDFWIADTIGNLTGTITTIFFELAIINPTPAVGRKLMAFITLGLIGYEFVQYFSPRSVLDWRDMIATLIGGAISWGIYELLNHRYREEILLNKQAG